MCVCVIVNNNNDISGEGNSGKDNDDNYELHKITAIRLHYDVIRWNHFALYWPFVQGIHRSLVNSMVTGEFPSQRPVKKL